MNRSNDFICIYVNLKITAQENLGLKKKKGRLMTNSSRIKTIWGEGYHTIWHGVSRQDIWILLAGLLGLSLAGLNVVFYQCKSQKPTLTRIYFADLWKLLQDMRVTASMYLHAQA